MINRKLIQLLIFIIPLLLSMGCIASGINKQETSLIFLGSVFLLVSGFGTPYIYLPVLREFKKRRLVSGAKFWQKLSKTIGLKFYITNKHPYSPSAYGTYRNHSISLTEKTERVANSSLIQKYLSIQLPVYNPNKVYFVIKDFFMIESKESFFSSILRDILPERLESRFILKTDSERFCAKLLKRVDMDFLLSLQNELSLEVIGQNLILKVKNVDIDLDQIVGLIDSLIDFTDQLELMNQRASVKAA